MSPTDGKAGFARRLNEAFDRLDIPPKQRGRFTAIGRLFSVSPVAARDWCEGNSYPSVDKLLLIMDTVRCGADWLLFGRVGEAHAATPALAGAASGSTLASIASASSEAQVAAAPAGAAADRDAGTAPAPMAGAAPALRWITVQGDSMAPTLLAGDEVGVAVPRAGAWRDGIYALRPGAGAGGGGVSPLAIPDLTDPAQSVLLRRVTLQLDGTLQLSCDHPAVAGAAGFRRLSATRWQSLAEEGGVVLEMLGRVAARRHPL